MRAGFELIIGLLCGFSFGGFMYCLKFDEREHINIVRCKECIWYKSLEEDGICNTFRVTPDNQEVNVYTQENDYCPYGERREECESEIDFGFIHHIFQGMKRFLEE